MLLPQPPLGHTPIGTERSAAPHTRIGIFLGEVHDLNNGVTQYNRIWVEIKQQLSLGVLRSNIAGQTKIKDCTQANDPNGYGGGGRIRSGSL